MKSRNNICLLLCVVILVVLNVLTISSPMRFSRQQAEREVVVKARLMAIRTAEEAYRRDSGVYAGNFALLIKGGYMADSLQYIPFSGSMRFELAADVQIGRSGRDIPLMECGAGYETYLKGLDDNSVAELIEDANVAGRYAGLKIGDIITPNNNAGNWE